MYSGVNIVLSSVANDCGCKQFNLLNSFFVQASVECTYQQNLGQESKRQERISTAREHHDDVAM